MYVVYKKKDGSIIASGEGTPFFAEDKDHGILEGVEYIAPKDRPNYRVIKDEVVESSRDVARIAALNREREARKRSELISRFWSLRDAVQDEYAAEAITILGELLFGKR